jgi:hypothetical protein
MKQFAVAVVPSGASISGDPVRCLALSLWFVVLFPLLAAECPPADVIHSNGHIITMDTERRVASALAIRDAQVSGRIANAKSILSLKPGDTAR